MTFFKRIQCANFREKLSMLAGILMILATAYSGLADIWGWPYGEYILETVTIIVVAVGTLLGAHTCVKVMMPSNDYEATEQNNALNPFMDWKTLTESEVGEKDAKES